MCLVEGLPKRHNSCVKHRSLSLTPLPSCLPLPLSPLLSRLLPSPISFSKELSRFHRPQALWFPNSAASQRAQGRLTTEAFAAGVILPLPGGAGAAAAGGDSKGGEGGAGGSKEGKAGGGLRLKVIHRGGEREGPMRVIVRTLAAKAVKVSVEASDGLAVLRARVAKKLGGGCCLGPRPWALLPGHCCLDTA